MSDALKKILSHCHLQQHYDYLSSKGFDSWEALQYLENTQTDYNQLQDIPYGHFKILVAAIKQYAIDEIKDEQNKLLRLKYQQFLKSLSKIQGPDVLFTNIDRQIVRYNELKSQYMEKWTLHQQYKSKISSFIMTKNEVMTAVVPVSSEEIRHLITCMQRLNGSLHKLFDKMGDPKWNGNASESSSHQESSTTEKSIVDRMKQESGDIIGGGDDMKSNVESKLCSNSGSQAMESLKDRKMININHSKSEMVSISKLSTEWMENEVNSLKQDVQLYVEVNSMKVREMTTECWKFIAVQHNQNYWKQSEFKGRSYKECKRKYKQYSMGNSMNMKQEMDEVSGSSAEPVSVGSDLKNVIGNEANDNISDSSGDEEDGLALLSRLQAPPQ